MRIRTLLLTLVASFTDASTFIGAGRLFSAHVTGNFIVLTYDLVHGADRHEWSKLLAFPMFFVAVMLAGKVDKWGAPRDEYRLLRIEGCLLLLAGLAAAATRLLAWRPDIVGVGIDMLVITAMGFQNAFGRLYSKSVFGPTTVMTGMNFAPATGRCSFAGYRLLRLRWISSRVGCAGRGIRLRWSTCARMR
jgi:uncharacterized membrane protein YoaK (UPF0700 family)